MLAQFLEDAFTAAQKSGAAAILPYEFVPHAYAYNASLYAFGTDSAAYTSSVAAMYKFQAQRVNSNFGCPAWHLAPCAPRTCHCVAPQARDHIWSTSKCSGCGLWLTLSPQHPVADTSGYA